MIATRRVGQRRRRGRGGVATAQALQRGLPLRERRGHVTGLGPELLAKAGDVTAPLTKATKTTLQRLAAVATPPRPPPPSLSELGRSRSRAALGLPVAPLLLVVGNETSMQRDWNPAGAEHERAPRRAAPRTLEPTAEPRRHGQHRASAAGVDPLGGDPPDGRRRTPPAPRHPGSPARSPMNATASGSAGIGPFRYDISERRSEGQLRA